MCSSFPGSAWECTAREAPASRAVRELAACTKHAVGNRTRCRDAEEEVEAGASHAVRSQAEPGNEYTNASYGVRFHQCIT